MSAVLLEGGLDRRSFLRRVAVTVGGVAVASALPVSLLQAGPATAACLAHDPCGDWTLDDACGAYPPYSFRRHAEHPRDASRDTVHLEGLDALFAA